MKHPQPFRWIALTLVLVMLLSAVPVLSASADTPTATVKGGWLRLRAQPSFDAKTVASYYTGTVVYLLGSTGAWYHVTSPDGITGYMYGAYLTLGGSPSPSGMSATVVSANGLGVRLRSGPSTAYGVLGLYSVGTKVTILNYGTSWHYVRIGNTRGYMMSQFLSTGSTPVPPSPSGYTAWVTSKNGLGVRLRSGAGTNYPVLGLYSVGTQVTVLSNHGAWDYIQVGSRKGYMMHTYLTTNPTTQNVSFVSINAAYTAVGDVLRVSMLTPASASVHYQWLNENNEQLSNQPTYTVRSQDLGHKIRLRVTGTNGYTGTALSSYAVVQSAPPIAPTPTPAPSVREIQGASINNSTPKVGQTLTTQVYPLEASARFDWVRNDGKLLGTGSSYTVQSSDVGLGIYVVAYGQNGWSGSVASYPTNDVVADTPAIQPLSGTVTLPAGASSGATLTPTLNLNTTQVAYVWTVNGAEVGYSKSLSITDAYAEKEVRLKVIALEEAGYTGQITSNPCIIAPLPVSAPVAPSEPSVDVTATNSTPPTEPSTDPSESQTVPSTDHRSNATPETTDVSDTAPTLE